MAQYRAEIKGNRKEASRLGTKESGMSAEINGWQSGVEVEATFNEATGEDEFHIQITAGSDGQESEKRDIGKVTRDIDGNVVFVPADMEEMFNLNNN